MFTLTADRQISSCINVTKLVMSNTLVRSFIFPDKALPRRGHHKWISLQQITNHVELLIFIIYATLLMRKIQATPKCNWVSHHDRQMPLFVNTVFRISHIQWLIIRVAISILSTNFPWDDWIWGSECFTHQRDILTYSCFSSSFWGFDEGGCFSCGQILCTRIGYHVISHWLPLPRWLPRSKDDCTTYVEANIGNCNF